MHSVHVQGSRLPPVVREHGSRNLVKAYSGAPLDGTPHSIVAERSPHAYSAVKGLTMKTVLVPLMLLTAGLLMSFACVSAANLDADFIRDENYDQQ